MRASLARATNANEEGPDRRSVVNARTDSAYFQVVLCFPLVSSEGFVGKYGGPHVH